MAGHSHDDQHLTEQKPVAFTVPFILAAVTIFIIIMFLSLCDPKAHHEGGHNEHQATEHASQTDAVNGHNGHEVNNEATHESAAPVAAESEAEHTAEPAHH